MIHSDVYFCIRVSATLCHDQSVLESEEEIWPTEVDNRNLFQAESEQYSMEMCHSLRPTGAEVRISGEIPYPMKTSMR